jgi:tetratricopeptide (TPR) repeat protein
MEAVVGNTDRGVLWRAGRDRPHDRIVRIVESRFADGAFRQAVSGLGLRQPAGMVEITGHDWTSDGDYYVEYATGGTWLTLAERLSELDDWQDRVVLLERVCSLFSRWQRSPVFPLGISLHNIIVVADDHWLPWLMPCPVITPATPCDLFGVDSVAIAALAPEIVRGVQPDNKAVDAYALGTLVAQALGADDQPPGLDDEERVEAQARGILWPSLTTGTRIPAKLGNTRAGEDLFRAVERYRQATPSARPVQAEDLRSALAAVADLVSLARELRKVDPVRAMDVLDWVRKDDGPARSEAALLAAEIAADRGDHELALRKLGDAVEAAPYRFDLRDRRCRAAWRLFDSLPPGRRRDELGTVIIADIALLEPAMAEDDDTTLRQRAAEVHLRCGNPAAAARDLFTALSRDPGDLDALLLYCRCWVELGDIPNARRTGTEARRRIDRMVETQLLTSGEAHQWYERFAQLLP